MNEINSRYLEFVNILISNKEIKDYKSFATRIGVSASAITEISKGRTNVGLVLIQKSVLQFPNLNLDWLINGIGERLKTKTTEKAIKINDGLNDSLNDSLPKLQKKLSNTEHEEKTKTTEKVVKLDDHLNDHLNDHQPKLQKRWSNESSKTTLQSIASDTLLSVPVVDISAAAGGGFLNTDYIDQTNIISLPRHLFKKRAGQRYCIKVVGYSMYPTLSPESYIVIRQLDRGEWGYIKDDHIYVITDTEGKTVVKRVLNDLYDCGLLRCISDNPDKVQYFDFAIPEAEISNVFEVELYFTADLNAINNMAVKQIIDQAEVESIKLSIQELQKSIIEIREKL